MTGDPALRFFVDLVEAEGGAAEDRGDSVLLLLGDGLRERLSLPEVLTVSDDPEVVSEEGGLLAVPGQPVVCDAAELVLRRGDAGWQHLEWPDAPPPTRGRLQEAARAELFVDHGRVDLDGQPISCWLPVLRVAALLEHRISVEERYEERAEVLVDARDGRPLPPRVHAALLQAAGSPGRGPGYVHLEADVHRAVEVADGLLDSRAAERQAALVREARAALEKERERVDAYYEALLASLGSRRAGASEDKARLYDTQEAATRAEWARRREETEEKFTGSRDVFPYRLHVVEVPALGVPLTVRRGARAFALHLDWLLPFSCFLPAACPHCGAEEPLVAGRDRLGCRACLPRAVHSAPPSTGPAGPRSTDPAGPPSGQSDGPPPAAPRADAEEHRDPDEGHEDPERRGTPGSRDEAGGQEEAKRSATSALRHKRVEKVSPTVAREFWQAVAFSERYPSVVARSPLEALYRCYGPRGPMHAIGLPPHVALIGAGTLTQSDDGEVVVTRGLVRTSGDAARFTLRWRLVGKNPSVAEVLPLPPPEGGGSLMRWRRGLDAFGLAAPPGPGTPRPTGLGPVELLLWEHAIGDGLALVVRCLALYWRVQGHRRVEAFGPETLAAAVDVVARVRSELRASPESAARRHAVPVAQVREACEAIRAVLGAAVEHLW